MQRSNRARRWTVWAAVAALGASLVACGTQAPGQDETPASSEGEVAPSSSPAATRPPEPEVVRVSDASEDCFNGFLEATECEGVDMTGLRIGPASMIPELSADPEAQDRLIFVVEFSEALAAVDEFGVFLYFDLDEDPTTGDQPTDLPGVDRLIAASPPTTDSWTEILTLDDSHGDIVRDPGLVSLRVEGNELIFLVHPSLLAEVQGEPPDGFVLYAIDARSITNEDYFNGDGALAKPMAVTVPAEVVAQVR